MTPTKGDESEQPDLEAYVGSALRVVVRELSPRLRVALPDDIRAESGDPYEILSCLLDHANRGRLLRHVDGGVVAPGHATLALRNRWAHPNAYEPMRVSETLDGLDTMIKLIQLFEGDATDLLARREAVQTASPTSVVTSNVWLALAEGQTEDDAPGFATGEVSARMSLRPGTEAAYTAAVTVVDQALRTDGSLFGAPFAAWTLENLRLLRARLLDRKESTLDSFASQYLTQLADAPTEVVQLAAEVLYVQFWISAKALSGERKRAALERVLALDTGTVRPEGETAAALDMGLVRTGAWFQQWRWKHLHLIVDVAERLRSLPDGERVRAVGDPWHWLEIVFPAGEQPAAQRHALLHLADPDTFEAIVSLDHKKQIRARFSDRLPRHSSGIDLDLFELRRVMAEEFGPRYDYYRPPVAALWQ